MQNFMNSYYEYWNSLQPPAYSEILVLGVAFYIWIFLFLVLEIILHEGGHCIFGLLTGYQLISFRIFNMTFLKERGRLRLRFYGIKGSGGQCLMKPPKYSVNKNRFVLYMMGGVIVDFLVFLFSVIMIFSPFNISFTIRMMFVIASLFTIGSMLVNGIPRKRGMINNDGSILYCLLKEKQAVRSGFIQLDIIPEMQSGATYKDLPENIIRVPEDAYLTNGLIAWHKTIECYYYMDKRLWDKALCCINELEEYSEKYNKLLKYTIQMEKMFIYIITGGSDTDIENLYMSTRKILKNKNLDFHGIRVRMAYELYKNDSPEMKQKLREELSKSVKTYPYKGEALFCAGLIGEMIN